MDAVQINTSENSRPRTSNENDVGMVPQHQVEICRVCLLGNSMMRSLFQVEGVLSLSDKAMSLTSVKMLHGDGLPSHICCDCSEKLELAYKFKLQVEQADSVLHERLDSLNIKEELFFSGVDVNLSTHRQHIGVITEESLLLKDHMDLLNVQKINEGDDDLQSDNVQKQTNNVVTDQCQVEKPRNEEENQHLSQDKEQMKIIQNQDLQDINNDQQIHNQENQLQKISNEQQNHSFGAHVLQEIMLHEINDQERMQELNQTHQLTMYEHNYVAESQPCDITNANHALKSEEVERNNKEGERNQQIYNITEESLSIEPTRRSKRKMNQEKTLIVEDFNEDNYFENLNLSSRLKVQSEKTKKVFFICYLCDKQFSTKEVLKEHMLHSHEEVRKTLSFVNNVVEKPENIPEKFEIDPTNSLPLKSPSSGKHPNTCPHCGKEYLYIISYNKHLKQHEKSEAKEGLMPLEVSFHEDTDALNFQSYSDNISMSSDSDEVEPKDEKKIHENKKRNTIKCNTCEEEFETINNLRNHRSKHVIDGILTEQDIKSDMEQFSIQEKSAKSKEDSEAVSVDGLKRSSSKKEESRDLKCPHCPMSYAHKKSLARHVESHSGAKHACKLCHQSFIRKDHLHRHIEQHSGRLKNFRCTECNKIFGNELTLKSHVIATNHKTTLNGKEFDPNKRVKRVAARAAQRIIDRIKTDLSLDEFEEDERERGREKNLGGIKAEFCVPKNDHTLQAQKKFQRNSMNFYCATCNQKYVSKHALTKHMEQHVKDENLIKQEKVKNGDGYRESQENEDDDEDDDDFESGLDWPTDSHECITCKKRYSTKKSLLRHQLLHEEPNFECDICNIKFYRKDKLKAHYDKCSEKNPDQVRKCNICGDSFENNVILKEHRIKHVTEGILTEEDLREIEPRPEDKIEEKVPRKRRTDIVGLECTECNKRYTSRKGLLRHIQVHEGKKYLCDICPKKFYRREHLKIHVAKHNMIKPYKCPRCTKRFIKEEQLNNHLTKHDRSFKKVKEADTSKRFLCEICSKSFTQSTTLIAHLRAHNGIKPYVCEVCSRPFTTNAYLKMHMRTHTQERPYICQYCSRAFARADTLANHLTTHTGEAKYHCKYCPKNFRRLKSLKEHVFIHTGQRPYACPTCDRRFNNNGSRYAHSKRCKQNALQIRAPSLGAQVLNAEHEREQQEQEQEQEQELQNQLQSQRLHQATISQAQIIKPQNIKTITIARSDGGLSQQHVMAHQEILMPLILPLTVTLTDVGEEVILPEGTKIFTA